MPTNDFELFPIEAIEQTISTHFERQALRFPDRLAISSRDERWTYADLNRIANAIADTIRAQGACADRPASAEKPIAILLDQGALAVAAILGVLKAGHIYAPLDASFPHSRLQTMMDDAGPGVLLTIARYLDLAEKLAGPRVAVINLDEVDLETPRASLQATITPDCGAHLLYTSGSTGTPKGVLQSHRNLLFEVLRVTNSFRICRDDRLALLHSCSSSASLRRIFPSLLNGASLHIYDLKTNGTRGLPAWFSREKITISNGRRLLRDCADELTGQDQFPHLRLVTFGGEPIYRRDVELFQRFLPPCCLLLNNLATTETGSDRHFFMDKDCELEGNLIPVGYETEGTRVLLLDENRREVGPGQIGEIAVQSRYLSLGYWRKPELTRERFLPDPDGEGERERIYLSGDMGRMDEDGCLFCIERKDFQMKVRGYRIEGAEVEAALLQLGIFKEAVVMAQDEAAAAENSASEKTLVAYLLTGNKPVPAIGELRRRLSQTLPDYMIPSAFVMMKEFPRTPSGKVDRRALPLAGAAQQRAWSTPGALRDELEMEIAAIWKDVLKLENIGVHDDFFELGGHSLLAARLFVEIEKQTGHALLPATLLQSPTVAQLADTLRREELSQPPAQLVAIQPHGVLPPVFCMQPAGGNVLGYRALARHLGSDQPVYGLQARSAGIDKARFPGIEVLALQYVAEIRAFQPRGPYAICGYSRGGLVAFAVAQLLCEQGAEVELLALLDTFGPDRKWKPLLPRASAHIRALKRLEAGQKARYVALRARKRAQLAKGFIEKKWRSDSTRAASPNALPKSCSSRPIYAGRVALFLASEQWTGLSYDDSHFGWGRFIEKLDVRSVPGDHSSIMKEPHVQTLARELALALTNARTGRKNSMSQCK